MEEKNRFVSMETTKGTMRLELYSARAPRTVERFMAVVNAGKYDDLKFHRIIRDFMVQGGDPDGNGTGGGSVKFEGSDVKHVPGVISMAAQKARVDQSDMQFFIMTSTSDQLDGNYTAFGHVTEGMEVLAAIAATPVAQAPWGERSRPLEDVRILKASEILE
ncbi:MAG: peptidylprolyl isomerase [Caldiserica bacterium]|nr:peptidylprolyl isomerase [Caldisericota bacterium]